MGQFKPMVKMMTTEPSIELKLKKGGHVAMPKMKSKSSASGHKKMAAGGSAKPFKCGTGTNMPNFPKGEMQGTAPAKPTMANRRAAMKGLKQHAALPASKAHKGLKTGGVAMGQGGYKNGGSVIPVSASKKGAKGYEETMMRTATPDRSPAKTGGVKMGNAGGYKKGGKVKMAMGGMTGYLQGVKNRITAPSAGSGTGSPRPFGPRGSGPNDAGTMGPRPKPKPRKPLPEAIDYRPNTPKKMALGGFTGMVKNAMNRVTAPKPGGGGGGGKPPVRIGYGPNDAPPGAIDRLKDQINNPSKPRKPLPEAIDYRPNTPKKMAMGGQIPLAGPRTRGSTTTPTRTMREMLDRARGELSGPRNPRPMPKPSPRGSGPNDAGPGRPLPFGGPKYDEYMPGGPKNPLRVPTKKSGGAARYAKGGGVEGNVSSTPAGVTGTRTGEVRKGNAGGFKKGGAPKKFARGGSVNDSGKAEKMPQGYKKPPTPVSINQLSGTYKRGGKVRKYAEGGASDKEREAYNRFYADEAAENKAEREAFIEAMKNPLDAMMGLPERLRKGYEAISKGLKGSGSVTTTEREVSRTVTPTKKRYGGAC